MPHLWLNALFGCRHWDWVGGSQVPPQTSGSWHYPLVEGSSIGVSKLGISGQVPLLL